MVKDLNYELMNLALTDEETTALACLLSDTIDGDRFPLSPRIRTLTDILNKLRPEPAREPLPRRKNYAPPRAAKPEDGGLSVSAGRGGEPRREA